MGYDVNKGPKSFRDKPNSLNSFINCVDENYRSNLYKYRIKLINAGVMPHKVKLSRSRYSFNNVHINIGNARWYSTTNNSHLVLDEKSLKNRQQLFQTNYRIVGDILDINYHVGSR